MKKKSIVTEFNQKSTPGVNVMKEKTNFVTGKMMDIEDIIRISYNYDSTINNDINLSGSNPNAAVQNQFISSLSNMSYDYIKNNSIVSLTHAETQTELENNTLTKWIFKFDSRQLLREYLYNEIYTQNPQSPFRDMGNILDGNKLSQACYAYIEANLMDRYRVKEFILWTEYHELKNNVIPGTGTDPLLNPEIKILYKMPVFTYNAIPNKNPDLNQKTIAMKEYTEGFYDIVYKQNKSSQYFTFIYYFDVIFEKI